MTSARLAQWRQGRSPHKNSFRDANGLPTPEGAARSLQLARSRSPTAGQVEGGLMFEAQHASDKCNGTSNVGLNNPDHDAWNDGPDLGRTYFSEPITAP